jgi:hypothetical protein
MPYCRSDPIPSFLCHQKNKLKIDMMRKITLIFTAVLMIVVACKKEDETETNDPTVTSSCDGAVCEPTLLSDETAASIPAGIQGTFSFTYDYAEPNSPFTNGKKATFTLTADNELIVDLEGEDCYTLKNPTLRFNGATGNYFFKDDCVKNICYNVSENQSGTLNEINVQPYSGVGWFGQFVLD